MTARRVQKIMRSRVLNVICGMTGGASVSDDARRDFRACAPDMAAWQRGNEVTSACLCVGRDFCVSFLFISFENKSLLSCLTFVFFS